MDTIRSKAICAQVVAAYSHCPRKAFLLHCTQEHGIPQEYLDMLEECTNVSRTRYLAVLRQRSTQIRSYGDSDLSSGIDVLTEANLKAGDLEAYCDVLTTVGSTEEANAIQLRTNRRSLWELLAFRKIMSLLSRSPVTHSGKFRGPFPPWGIL